ncbi:hypothetical protein [Sutterella sp.]|uniref:hypothetical protein n=1 Tax=Sutterella sp. TaxID=1981025 RepID=UPI0026E088D8|nr:hypothetical protein [Sutterella sp.]MDO5532559.1 hypothetical protein [Sutterella sp.]
MTMAARFRTLSRLFLVFVLTVAAGLYSVTASAELLKQQKHRAWTSAQIVVKDFKAGRASVFGDDKKWSSLFAIDVRQNTFYATTIWVSNNRNQPNKKYPDCQALIRIDKKAFNVTVTPRMENGIMFLYFHMKDLGMDFINAVKAGNRMTIDYIQGDKVFRTERYSLSGATAALNRAVKLMNE